MKVVEKYGGSSVATLEQIKKIAQHVKERRDQGDQLVIVASAMGKTTNELLSLAGLVNAHQNARELDSLLSTGEQQSITLLALAIDALGIPVVSLTGLQCGLMTTSDHTHARIKDIDLSKLQSCLAAGKVVIVAGFQGVSTQGEITTLGRGGSDTTAVALAAKLGWECHIYTDVDGVYTIDPRIYPNPEPIAQLSYGEMMELAHLGAGVLETRSVELASKYQVMLFVGKALDDRKGKGTYIMDHVNRASDLEEMPIIGISVKEGYELIRLKHIPEQQQLTQRLMEFLARLNVNLDFLSQQRNEDHTSDITVLCDEAQAERIKLLQTRFQQAQFNTQPEMIKLSLVGMGIATHGGLAAKAIHHLHRHQIDYEMIATSELSITFVLHAKDKILAASILMEAFQLQHHPLQEPHQQVYAEVQIGNQKRSSRIQQEAL